MKENETTKEYFSVGGIQLEAEKKGMSTSKLFHDILNIVLSIFNVYLYIQILTYVSKIEDLPLGQFIITALGIIYIFISVESFKHNLLKSIKYV